MLKAEECLNKSYIYSMNIFTDCIFLSSRKRRQMWMFLLAAGKCMPFSGAQLQWSSGINCCHVSSSKQPNAVTLRAQWKNSQHALKFGQILKNTAVNTAFKLTNAGYYASVMSKKRKKNIFGNSSVLKNCSNIANALLFSSVWMLPAQPGRNTLAYR